jgi:hypothetical protein
MADELRINEGPAVEEPVMDAPDEVMADMRSTLERLLWQDALETLRHTQEVQFLTQRVALLAWEAWRATCFPGDRDALRAAATELHRIGARLSAIALAPHMEPWPGND